jgi:hypothetical protein
VASEQWDLTDPYAITSSNVTADPIQVTVDDIQYVMEESYISDDHIVLDPAYINGSDNTISFQILSPEQSALQSMSDRIRMFHQWLLEEQKDLEEECNVDLSGLIDKLEETFPEISGEPETSDGLDDQENIFNTEEYIRWFEEEIRAGRAVLNDSLEIDEELFEDGTPGLRAIER